MLNITQILHLSNLTTQKKYNLLYTVITLKDFQDNHYKNDARSTFLWETVWQICVGRFVVISNKTRGKIDERAIRKIIYSFYRFSFKFSYSLFIWTVLCWTVNKHCFIALMRYYEIFTTWNRDIFYPFFFLIHIMWIHSMKHHCLVTSLPHPQCCSLSKLSINF